MLLPRILNESSCTGSRFFSVILTAFRWVFIHTSTPETKIYTELSLISVLLNHINMEISCTNQCNNKKKKMKKKNFACKSVLRINPNSWVAHRTTHHGGKLGCPKHFLVAVIIVLLSTVMCRNVMTLKDKWHVDTQFPLSTRQELLAFTETVFVWWHT